MALRLVDRTEIRSELGRLHDDFAEKQRTRADHLGCHSHDTNQSMYLRKVPVICAKLLPDIRCCVKTDNINAVVAEIQHISCHIVENDRVAVVQIPLIRIEHSHDRLADFRNPCEVAGRSCREYLRNGLLIFIRNCPVVKEEVSVLILFLAGACSLRPLMILARMIHDEVEADIHSLGMAVNGKLIEVFHCTELRLDLSEIGNSITAVAAVFRTLKKRHQVNEVGAALLNIVKFCMYTLEGSREAIGINNHSEHIVALVPVRHKASHIVPLFQLGRAGGIIFMQHFNKIVKRLLVVIVEFLIKPLHLIVMHFKALNKLRFPVLIDHVFPP